MLAYPVWATRRRSRDASWWAARPTPVSGKVSASFSAKPSAPAAFGRFLTRCRPVSDASACVISSPGERRYDIRSGCSRSLISVSSKPCRFSQASSCGKHWRIFAARAGEPTESKSVFSRNSQVPGSRASKFGGSGISAPASVAATLCESATRRTIFAAGESASASARERALVTQSSGTACW